MALKVDAKFEGKLTCTFKNDMTSLANFHKLKNSYFILESKMAELNENKNSKQLDQTNAARKLCFALEINSTYNKNFYKCSTELLFLSYKTICKKAVKLGSFLQCSVNIFLQHDGCFWKINLRILWNHIM